MFLKDRMLGYIFLVLFFQFFVFLTIFPERKIQVCSKISDKFGKHGLMKPKQTVRSLANPVRMFDGMDEEQTPKKQVEVLDGPVLSERDRAKLERKKRKEERQREVC